jgi:putative ABC transport system ATP-binding protein
MDNVELSLGIANVSRSERKKRAAQLLETVGLKDRMKHKPAELSGGQQQRVAIARALANNPTFLLLDEPTGNIDSKTAHELMEIIKNLNAKGVTIIMVTHDQHLAREAKRTVQMMDGVIISDEVNMQ